jgi:L-cysteine S-thiosulfotransferase
MKWKMTGSVIAVALMFLGAGCDSGPRSGRGLRLPQGDVAAGKQAFIDLKCHTCHTVAGVDLPKPESPGQYHVVLGGQVLKVKTYGQLVTAIIHPAHDIAKGFDQSKTEGQLSPMPQFNHVMTVQQMIDLTDFLHAHYEKMSEYTGPVPYGI